MSGNGDAGAIKVATLKSDDQAPVFRRLLKLTWSYRGSLLILLLLNSQEIVLALVGLRLLGLGIDILRHEMGGGAVPVWPLGLVPPAAWSPWTTITILSASILGAAVLAMLTRFTSAVFAAWAMQARMVVELRRRVYAKLQRLSFRFFDANETGAIIQRVTTDVQGMREFVEVVMLQSITIAVSLAIYLVYMFRLHVPLTLACLASTPALWWLVVHFSRRVRPAYREARDEVDSLVRHIVEDVQGVHVIKGFALEDTRRAAFDGQNAVVRNKREGIFRRVAVFIPQVHVLQQVNMIVLLGYGGWLVIHGQLGLGAGLLVFAGLLGQFAANVQNIAQVTNSVQNSLTGAQRVFEILDATVEVKNVAAPQALAVCRGALRFTGVGFGYRPEEPVLRGIDLDVPAGACVAVLGETGTGKSTFLSLIPRFYDPTAGSISLDGVDLREIRLDDLRRQVGVVFQESFLFSTSVAANIAFGHPDATRAQIEQAARIACAHDFIMALDGGYNAVIGERGADLSGGQRQRIAIARAILTDPRILLLDDATAAVDPETEHEIMAAMESAMTGRTTFIVAHRLSTLRRADQVIVIAGGHIIERGTHDELMAQDGPYHEAASLQQAQAESKRLLAEGGAK